MKWWLLYYQQPQQPVFGMIPHGPNKENSKKVAHQIMKNSVVEKKSYISINIKEKEPYSRSYQRVTSCRKIKIKILSSLYKYIFW